MLVSDIVTHAARTRPEQTALVDGTRVFTFAELDDRVHRLAGGLLGIARPGDRVAMIAENCAAWVESYYGVPRAGMVLTFLNQRLGPSELAGIVESSGATVVIGQTSHLERLASLLGEGRMASVTTTIAVETDYEELLAAAEPPPTSDALSAADVAWLIYTSGTTGKPKGAMLTHTNVVAGALNGALCRPVAPYDVYLMPFPLCHVAGHNVLIQHLHGRPVVLVARFDAASFVEVIGRNGVTTASLAPTMLSSLLDHVSGDAHAAAVLRSLRAIGYGASAMPVELLRRILDELSADLSQGYGMTELAGNATFLGPAEHRRAAAGHAGLLASCGRPGPMADVRVVNPGGHDVATGELGEIVVRGDQVTTGYWRDPEATQAAFLGSWLRTGDLGRVDDDGYLYVIDRAKDIIITGGENVASLEVEDAILALEGVAAVAVVAVPDAHWGEAVCAVVVRRPGAAIEAADVVDAVRDRLASFKKPRHVLFVDSLPVNHAGKVVKTEVRQMAAAEFSPAD